nr:hypothetical protein [Anaerobacillus isosaccharinicus]
MLDFFEMKGVPFTREILIEQLYSSSSYNEATARLEYAAENRQFAY